MHQLPHGFPGQADGRSPLPAVKQEWHFQDKDTQFYRFAELELSPEPGAGLRDAEELLEALAFLAQLGPDALLTMALRKPWVAGLSPGDVEGTRRDEGAHLDPALGESGAPKGWGDLSISSTAGRWGGRMCLPGQGLCLGRGVCAPGWGDRGHRRLLTPRCPPRPAQRTEDELELIFEELLHIKAVAHLSNSVSAAVSVPAVACVSPQTAPGPQILLHPITSI